MQKLPISGFHWSNVTLQDIIDYDPNGDIGYFVEVDCHIPEELHDKLNFLVPFPEPINVDSKLTSEFTQNLQRARFGKVPRPSKKLAPNLLPKKKYKCHILALQLYLR